MSLWHKYKDKSLLEIFHCSQTNSLDDKVKTSNNSINESNNNSIDEIYKLIKDDNKLDGLKIFCENVKNRLKSGAIFTERMEHVHRHVFELLQFSEHEQKSRLVIEIKDETLNIKFE